MNPFEEVMGLDYEPWIVRLPAPTDQCAVCGRRDIGTFDFWQNGPMPTEHICDACGFEYGGNTFLQGITFERYREEWKAKGCPWWFSFGSGKQPASWNPEANFADLEHELARAAHVTLRERVPALLAYYEQCISLTLNHLPTAYNADALRQALALLGESRITGGGSNSVAYRFSNAVPTHDYDLIQPNRGSTIPPIPLRLFVASTGQPVRIENSTGERTMDITSEQLAEAMRQNKPSP